MKKKDEEWALFWCSLLHPALFEEIDPKEVQQFLRELTQEERLFPNGVRKKPALSTLRSKLNLYREKGFYGFARKVRSDRGKQRAHDKDIVKRAIELKLDQPKRSDRAINKVLKSEKKKTIPKSSLYRYLKDAGATKIKLGVTGKKVRCRWTRDHTHDLWQGDFENGPYVIYEDRAVQTHLCAFIDCHSRHILDGRYYYRQNLDILIDSLLRAWAIHGASSELYVDNAKVYHSNALKKACLALNIKLLHRTKGDPSPGGLIEKFIQNVQEQFESEVRAGRILTLEELNRRFSAWLNQMYHRTPHSETKQKPEERYRTGLKVYRHVDMERIIQFFMAKEHRTVHRDFSDIRLFGRFYRVDKKLRGDRVEVRYDPFSGSDTVLLYSLKDETYLGEGTLHHREKGEESSPPPPKKAKFDFLGFLVRKEEEELQAKIEGRGIDFRKALSKKRWPFPAFAGTFALLMGHKGGISAFNAHELESLQKVYDKNPDITERRLRTAFERAKTKTIPYIIYELQEIINRKEPV